MEFREQSAQDINKMNPKWTKSREKKKEKKFKKRKDLRFRMNIS